MRLLEYTNDDEFSPIEFLEGDIPPYAILSHRWEEEEVVLKDLTNGTCKQMAGYSKIQFCGRQARRDGLQYFWVNTCCIDKTNAVELAEAINSMFRWYRNAKKCYVYLSDVSWCLSDSIDETSKAWEPAYRKCKWFTRGWTLQELIAPIIVEFYSKERELLGNRKSLERQISDRTGIPVKALRGGPLSDFSIAERMSWAEARETTHKEDLAYSLLGIFDVNMPLIYGEGKDRALKRLREEIERDRKGTKYEDFSVPFSLADVVDVTQFVAREAELTEIHTRLGGDGSRRIVVLHGLGGIGKTQLSTAYAKRHKENYSAIFWLNIKDVDTLKQSFSKIAKQILRAHPSASLLRSENTNNDLDKVVDAVKAWLSLPDNTRWLMIYDNYDNPKLPENTDSQAVDIRQFLPESYQGSIIITTRSARVIMGHTVQVRKLENIHDSLKILSTVSRRSDLINDPDAVILAKELDGLPLALATAGAYLDQVAESPAGYLRLYKASWSQLEEFSPELASYHDRKLYSTWQISFKHVETQNPLSAKLLCFWAYFDNQDLWYELLQHSGSRNPNWVRQVAENEAVFHNAMRVLSNHGLVELETSVHDPTESRGYSIHGCVHAWSVSVLNQSWDHELAKLAVNFVASHVPDLEVVQSWSTQRRLLQHASRCSYVIENSLVLDDDMAWEYNKLGLLYANQDKLVEAEQMYQRALQGTEKVFGPEHTSTLDIVNNLGNLYMDQDKLVEAEQMFQRALQGYKKAFGINFESHDSTLRTNLALASLSERRNEVGKARVLYTKVLSGWEKVFGAEHPGSRAIQAKVRGLDTLLVSEQ